MRRLIPLVLLTSSVTHGAELTAFIELGAYHRLGMSDPLITTNDAMGSDTPGTIDFGVEFSKCSWFLGARKCSLLWHHQSYVDRGYPFNDGPEAQLDMIGFRARWEWRL